MTDEEEEQKIVNKWLGRFILLKYLGYGVFGSSLALIILSSLLQWIWLNPILFNGVLVGLAFIIIGLIFEKVLSQ